MTDPGKRGLCVEMAELLPTKIENLRQGLALSPVFSVSLEAVCPLADTRFLFPIYSSKILKILKWNTEANMKGCKSWGNNT